VLCLCGPPSLWLPPAWCSTEPGAGVVQRVLVGCAAREQTYICQDQAAAGIEEGPRRVLKRSDTAKS
jgi:hypothetical protein